MSGFGRVLVVFDVRFWSGLVRFWSGFGRVLAEFDVRFWSGFGRVSVGIILCFGRDLVKFAPKHSSGVSGNVGVRRVRIPPVH